MLYTIELFEISSSSRDLRFRQKRKRIMMITSDTKEAPLMKARMVVT